MIAVGTVAVTVGGEPIAALGSNEVVGERGPIVAAPRSATVTAVTALYTYAISRDGLLEPPRQPQGPRRNRGGHGEELRTSAGRNRRRLGHGHNFCKRPGRRFPESEQARRRTMVGALEWDVYKESLLMSSTYLDDVAHAFREAADAFGEIVALPEVGKSWEQPSVLEGYSVGAIVTHINSAVGWLRPLLDAPAEPNLRPSPREDLLRFFHSLKLDPEGAERDPIHEVLKDKFERAAGHGWESNRDKFLGLAASLTSRLEGESAERLVDLRPFEPLVLRLGDFLPTRILELVVHADDLAASVGLDAPLPESVATVAIDLMVAVARTGHGDLAVVRALARRERADPAVFPVF